MGGAGDAMTRRWRTAALALALGAACLGAPARAAGDDNAPRPGDVVAGPDRSGTGAAFRFIVEGGSVGFDIPGNWPTLAMQPRPPVAVAAFQIPNPAGAGTGDSASVAVSVFSLDDERGRAAREAVAKAYGPTPPTVSQVQGWTVYRQDAVQGSTTYTVLNAVREFPQIKAAASVLLAWPHLSGNPASYDADMEQLHRSMLDSISAQSGAYSLGPREVVRRPTPRAQ